MKSEFCSTEELNKRVSIMVRLGGRQMWMMELGGRSEEVVVGRWRGN